MLFFFGRVSFGQLKIGGDPHQIHPYAVLDLESTNKGLLLPRLTTLERNQAFTQSIPAGLLYYNTDFQRLEVWTSEQTWMPLAYKEDTILDVIWDHEAFSLQIGSAIPVDLSGLQPAPPQQLSMEADQLVLEKGGTIDLSRYRSLPQELTIAGDQLSITGGNSISLASLLNSSSALPSPSLYWKTIGPDQMALGIREGNEITLQVLSPLRISNISSSSLMLTVAPSPPQELSLEGSRLVLSEANSIDLAPLLTTITTTTTTTATSTATSTMTMTTAPFQLQNGTIDNSHTAFSTLHFLFGAPTMDNQTGPEDDARFFFHKGKAAFRAGYASNNSWNVRNIGNYSFAANYRTEAKGHRSLALGNSTIAESFSETVLGSYNRTSEETDKDDWIPHTRLFTLGNGSSNSNRSNALVILKNGNTGINTSSFGIGAEKVLAIGAGTPPTSAVSSAVQLYVSQDSSQSFQLTVMDVEGNSTVLSPHRFDLLPKSEPMAWSYYSKNGKHKQIINVDLLAVIRVVEQLSGARLVHLSDLDGNRIEEAKKSDFNPPSLEDLHHRIEQLEQLLRRITSEMQK